MDDGSVEPELGRDERRALGELAVAEPPPGFADRVLAAARGEVPAAAPRTPVRRRFFAVPLAAAAIGAVVLAVAMSRAPRGVAQSGESAAAERRSIVLGGRGVAVAEAGASLQWQVAADGAARLSQPAGSVFYRINPGGPLTVETPLGAVRVTGTCFAIEVIMNKQAMIGATAGAALAAAVIVTVYEGGVVVAGNHGEAKVKAGEQATLSPSRGPLVADAKALAPAASLGRDELIARDEQQRNQIATLRARLEALEAGGGGPSRGGRPLDIGSDGRPWFDPGPEELAEMAKGCRIRLDMPPVMGSEPFTVGPEMAKEAALTPAEVAQVNQALAELHRSWGERVRALYVEVTGDAAHADDLSPQAMAQEIEDKSLSGERGAVQRRLAQERAGLAQPPPDLGKASAYERYLRALAGLSGEAERAIGAKIGPERARELHAKNGGWPMRMEMAGCPGEGGSATEDL